MPDVSTPFTQRLKRWTILVHRCLGLGLSLLCLMWFATGIVLMYAPLPEFRPDRQLERMPVVDCTRCTESFHDALARMPGREPTTDVRLGMLLDRPVWRYLGTDHRWHLQPADTGAPLQAIAGGDAVRIAARYAEIPALGVRESVTITEPDQWTMEGVLRSQLPLHRIEFGDPNATRVYVSAAGGEAVLATTRRERGLAWIGAIPHFLYPRFLRSRLTPWLGTVIMVSGLGAALSLTGLIIGIWQLRIRHRANRFGRTTGLSPYRPLWLRWHHYLGLLFGLGAFTWLLSGMLSVNPFEWSPGDEATPAEQLSFAGGALDGRRFSVPPEEAARRLFGGTLRELRPTMVAGRAYWVGIDSASATQILPADTIQSPVLAAIPSPTLAAGLGLLLPGRLASVDELHTADNYYYDRLGRHRPLPVLRARAGDDEGTAYYVDPGSGLIAMKQTGRSRAERWLYSGLHDLDFYGLAGRRPLWDLIVIGLLLGGLALAATGIMIGWRWLVRLSGPSPRPTAR